MDMIQSALRRQTMAKTDLIQVLSKDTGLTIRTAEEVVKAVFNSMANALANNERWRSGALGLSRSNTMMDIPGTTLRQANISRSNPRSCRSSNAATS
jgi:hypothetical protein